MSLRLHTSLPESHDTGHTLFTPLLLQPRLATSWSAFLTSALPNLQLISLHPTAPLSILRLCFASYIPLGSTGISAVCGLCPPLSTLWASPYLDSLPSVVALFHPLLGCSLVLLPTLYSPVRLAPEPACSSSLYLSSLWTLPIATLSFHASNTSM